MNLSLIDPFILAQDYPDALVGKLRQSQQSYLMCDLMTFRLRPRHLRSLQSERRLPRLRTRTLIPAIHPLEADSECLQFDGTIVIFDAETNGIAHKLRGHNRQIQSLR
jgi:COMPASS component SWD1